MDGKIQNVLKAFIGLILGAAILSPAAYADSLQNFSITLVVESPPEVIGIQSALEDAGFGLAGFLTAIQDPTVNIILALSVILIIIGIVYGFSYAIKRAGLNSIRDSKEVK